MLKMIFWLNMLCFFCGINIIIFLLIIFYLILIGFVNKGIKGVVGIKVIVYVDLERYI